MRPFRAAEIESGSLSIIEVGTTAETKPNVMADRAFCACAGVGWSKSTVVPPPPRRSVTTKSLADLAVTVGNREALTMVETATATIGSSTSM